MTLPFFEYRGPGSPHAELCKRCGCTPAAHVRPGAGWQVCPTYVAQGPSNADAYYCGCWGWD